MEIWIAVIIIIALTIVLYVSRKEGLKMVDEDLAKKQQEKESWNRQKFMTFSEVQKLKAELETVIDDQFGGDQQNKNLLKEIVQEWADLKIRSFHERRSWVRRPKKQFE